MPVLAVGGALLAISEAIPVVTGIIAGTVEIGALSSILTLTAAVGATVGAIGSVTGDKDLATAGFIMAGVSGIGMIATSTFGDVNLFSQTAATQATEAPAFVNAADAAIAPQPGWLTQGTDYVSMFAPQETSALGGLTGASLSSLSVPAIAESAFTLPGSMTSGLESVADSVDPLAAGTQYADASIGGNTGRDFIFNNSSTVAEEANPLGQNWLTGNKPYSQFGSGLITGTPDAAAATPMGSVSTASTTPELGYEPGVDSPAPTLTEEPLTGGETAPKTFLDRFEDKLNKVGNYLDKHGWAAQTAAGFLMSAFDPSKKQMNEAEAAAYRARAAQVNLETANVASGVPMARLKPVQRAPVTGYPTYPTAQQGIINSPVINRM